MKKLIISNGGGALKTIKKQFPEVTKIVDAKQSLVIKVTPQHNAKARKKDPHNCALAKACVEKKIANGAIIGIGNSYLIKGKVATRYKTSNTVGREITSFDRHQNFQPGVYILSRISPSNRLGAKRPYYSGPKIQRRIVHRTDNIRVLVK